MTEWQDWLGIYTFYSFYLLTEYINFSLFAYHYGHSFHSLHSFTQPQPLFSFWCSNRLSFGQWKHFLGWLPSPLDMTHWSLKNVLVFWHIKIFQAHLSAPRMESDFSPNDPLFLLVWKICLWVTAIWTLCYGMLFLDHFSEQSKKRYTFLLVKAQKFT